MLFQRLRLRKEQPTSFSLAMVKPMRMHETKIGTKQFLPQKFLMYEFSRSKRKNPKNDIKPCKTDNERCEKRLSKTRLRCFMLVFVTQSSFAKVNIIFLTKNFFPIQLRKQLEANQFFLISRYKQKK